MARLLLAVFGAYAVAACGTLLPGEEPVHLGVEVVNMTSSNLHFAPVINGAIARPTDTLAAGETQSILDYLGNPPINDPIFRGGHCTIVDVVALDSNSNEVARHPPGLCFGDRWVIGAPFAGTPSPESGNQTDSAPTLSISTPSPTSTMKETIDCGQVKNSDPTFASFPAQHYSLVNPDGLFSTCEIAELLGAPSTKNFEGGDVLRAGPDVFGRLTFTFTDGVCWDRVLHVDATPNTTPIPAYTFITGPTLPAGHWFDLSVETVYTNSDPCPAIAASRGARIRLADWPETPIETTKATPTSYGPGST